MTNNFNNRALSAHGSYHDAPASIPTFSVSSDIGTIAETSRHIINTPAPYTIRDVRNLLEFRLSSNEGPLPVARRYGTSTSCIDAENIDTMNECPSTIQTIRNNFLNNENAIAYPPNINDTLREILECYTSPFRGNNTITSIILSNLENDNLISFLNHMLSGGAQYAENIPFIFNIFLYSASLFRDANLAFPADIFFAHVKDSMLIINTAIADFSIISSRIDAYQCIEEEGMKLLKEAESNTINEIEKSAEQAREDIRKNVAFRKKLAYMITVPAAIAIISSMSGLSIDSIASLFPSTNKFRNDIKPLVSESKEIIRVRDLYDEIVKFIFNIIKR